MLCDMGCGQKSCSNLALELCVQHKAPALRSLLPSCIGELEVLVAVSEPGFWARMLRPEISAYYKPILPNVDAVGV
jgi:hypothetical protein